MLNSAQIAVRVTKIQKGRTILKESRNPSQASLGAFCDSTPGRVHYDIMNMDTNFKEHGEIPKYRLSLLIQSICGLIFELKREHEITSLCTKFTVYGYNCSKKIHCVQKRNNNRKLCMKLEILTHKMISIPYNTCIVLFIFFKSALILLKRQTLNNVDVDPNNNLCSIPIGLYIESHLELVKFLIGYKISKVVSLPICEKGDS